jgi:hypothetical protein
MNFWTLFREIKAVTVRIINTEIHCVGKNYVSSVKLGGKFTTH